MFLRIMLTYYTGYNTGKPSGKRTITYAYLWNLFPKEKNPFWLANLFGTREAEEAEMKEKTSNSPTTSKGCKERPSKTTHAHNNYQETRLEESSEASSIPYGNHLG